MPPQSSNSRFISLLSKEGSAAADIPLESDAEALACGGSSPKLDS